MSDDLLAAYERLHRAGPEYGGDEEGNHGLTNHGPMFAEVVTRRGLDVRLDQWLDHYVRRLTDLPTSSGRITGWRDALGDGHRIADWTAYFRSVVRDGPWQDTLATWWPRLLPGIAAGATHGVIRVGHAVRTLRVAESPQALDELANGLAFWAARWRTVPGTTARDEGPLRHIGPAEALDALPRLADRTGLIAHRLTRLGELHGWQAAIAALPRPADVPTALAALVDAATLRYLRVGADSPVLLVHTATAPNAVLHCLPVLPASLWQPSLTAAWAAAAAITATYAGPPGTRSTALLDTADPASTLLDRAATHGDEHVLKFADTAVESFERTGNADALAAAHFAADLIASPVS